MNSPAEIVLPFVGLKISWNSLSSLFENEALVYGVVLGGVAILLFVLFGTKWDAKRPPGPFAWPVVGNILQLGSLPHRTITKLHKIYGHIIYLRLGIHPTVVTDDPKYIREFCQNQDHIFASRPQTIAIKVLTYGAKDFAMAEYGPHWRTLRRMAVQEVLAPKKLDSFTQQREEEADFMVKHVLQCSETTQAIGMRDIFADFSMNNVSRMMVGKRYLADTDADRRHLHDAIEKGFYTLGSFNIGDYVPFLERFDLQGLKRDMKNVMGVIEERFDANIEMRRKAIREEGKGSYFLDTLLTVPGENGAKHLDQETIRALMLDMIAAGTDTSSITNEWALARFILHPHVQKKVQAELDAVVGKNRKVLEADLRSLSYLQACIKETFRLHNPGPFNVPHMATKDSTVLGYRIAKGTRILINAFGLGRNPEVWDKAGEYNPDRWLQQGPDQNLLKLRAANNQKNSITAEEKSFQEERGAIDLRDPDLRIIPFGIGRRSCPASTLGSTMVLLALARLLHSFDWYPDPAHPFELVEKFGTTAPPAKSLRAVAVPRLAIHLYSAPA